MNETISRYRIKVSEPMRLVKSGEQQELPGFARAKPIELTIAGSRSFDKEANQRIFGRHIAEMVAKTALEAASRGHKLVLDAATGSSPKFVWEALAGMVVAGEADLSNLIVIGHEEAWGPKPGSSTDFDFQRRQMMKTFGIEPKDITPYDVDHELTGNFVPMNYSSMDRSMFLEKEIKDGTYELAEDLAAIDSAVECNQIVRELLKRSDVESLGVYGIGTDGHIGEWQIQDMGYRAAMGKRDAFAQPQEHYSEEAGQFPIAKKGRDNFYWKRGMKRGEVYQEGRVARQPEMGSQEVVVGLGLRDMLKLDHVIFAFNNATKDDAFALAMEGSVGGRIEEDGSDIGFIERKKGEGEKIWDELSEFALELEKAKVLRPGTVEMINKRFAERRNPKKCGLLYRAIYKAFDKQQIPGGSRFYEIMGDYSKKYIGRRSPLGQFIRMRERLGRDNIIVATPEVVKGTTYEALAA